MLNCPKTGSFTDKTQRDGWGVLRAKARTKTVEIVVVLGEFSCNSTQYSFLSPFSLSFFLPSISPNDQNSPECLTFVQRQSMSHGTVVILVGGSECLQAENPGLEPCVPYVSALGSEHMRSHSVQCCTTFSHWTLNKNNCDCCLLYGQSMPIMWFCASHMDLCDVTACNFVLPKWCQLWEYTPSEILNMSGFS